MKNIIMNTFEKFYLMRQTESNFKPWYVVKKFKITPRKRFAPMILTNLVDKICISAGMF